MKREHKELAKDVANIAIGFTPIWWIISISKFAHKWGYKKRGTTRLSRYIQKVRRRRPLSTGEIEELLGA